VQPGVVAATAILDRPKPTKKDVLTVAGTPHEAPGVPVVLAANRTEAELIVGMLRSNGVRAVVSADDAGGQEPQLQIHGVRVLVAPSDEAFARELLAADDNRS
jgi:Putative prokaryotic signal transducing protein